MTSQLEEAQVEVDALQNTKSMIALNKAISVERDSLLGEKDRLKVDLDVLRGEVNLLKSSNQILLKDSSLEGSRRLLMYPAELPLSELQWFLFYLY